MPFIQPCETTRNNARYKTIDCTDEFILQEHRYSLRKSKHYYWVRIITRATKPRLKVAQAVSEEIIRGREWRFIAETLPASLPGPLRALPPGHLERTRWMLDRLVSTMRALGDDDDLDEDLDFDEDEEDGEEGDDEDDGRFDDADSGSWPRQSFQEEAKEVDGKCDEDEGARMQSLLSQSQQTDGGGPSERPRLDALQSSGLGSSGSSLDGSKKPSRFNIVRRLRNGRAGSGDLQPPGSDGEGSATPPAHHLVRSRSSVKRAPSPDVANGKRDLRRSQSAMTSTSQGAGAASGSNVFAFDGLEAPAESGQSGAMAEYTQAALNMARAALVRVGLQGVADTIGLQDPAVADLDLPQYLTTAESDPRSKRDKLTMDKLKRDHERRSMAKGVVAVSVVSLVMRAVSFDAFLLLLVALNVAVCWAVRHRHSLAKQFVKGSIRRRVKFSRQVWKDRWSGGSGGNASKAKANGGSSGASASGSSPAHAGAVAVPPHVLGESAADATRVSGSPRRSLTRSISQPVARAMGGSNASPILSRSESSMLPTVDAIASAAAMPPLPPPALGASAKRKNS